MWLRKIEAKGMFMDVDMIKWKFEGSEIVPCAITELTRCDSQEVGEPYLSAIIERYFKRDIQGKVITKLANLLEIPAYLVLFQKEMKWLCRLARV